MKIFYYLLPLLIITNANSSSAIDKFNYFLESNNAAEIKCDNIARNRENPSQDIINFLRDLNSTDRVSYLIYKSEASMSKCVLENGGYPGYVIDGLYYSDDSSNVLKQMIDLYREAGAKSSILDAMHHYGKISNEKKKYLNGSKYFDQPFKPINISELINNRAVRK